MTLKAQLMDDHAMQRATTRIAHEILEHNRDTENLVFIGIRRRGVPLAKRLSEAVAAIEENVVPPVGTLDIFFYRDDLSTHVEQPTVRGSDVPFDIEGRTVVLVDDVIYTGRTIRAALDALTDIGRAQRIQLAVMIDRGHRELPIRPDYVGKNIPTSSDELIAVHVEEFDGENSVLLYQRDSEEE